MNPLLDKYQEYMKLCGCVASYELKNGTILQVPFLEENFPHLIGLHKLTDIQLIQFWLDKNNKTIKLPDITKAIKNEVLTESMLKKSNHFTSIASRYEYFSYNNLTTLSYSDAVINFEPTKAHSQIKSDYLLFEQKENGFNHLGIANDKIKGRRYIETFFHETSDQYIKGQTIEPIVKFTITDRNNKIIVSDTF